MSDEVQLKEVKNIHEAVVAIMEQVGYVQKTRSPNLNYTYAGEAGLISAIRPWMVAYGVYVSVVSISDVTHERYETANGKQMVNTTLTAVIRFTHAASNTSFDVYALGEGSDTGDKSQNKALTGAYKYALRQTFCIETGDDPDKDSSDGMEKKTGTKSVKSNGNGSKPAHTQAELVAYAKKLSIEGADFITVMTNAGFKNADMQSLTRWDEMIKAIDIASGKVATPGL